VRWSAAAALVLGLVLLAPAAAQESDRPAGRIVVPRAAELVAVFPASGVEEPVAVSPGPALILDAALSPDGQQAVFASLTLGQRGELGGAGLYRVPIRGGEPRLLLGHDAPGARFTTPMWAADGASVLYTYTPYVVGSSGPEAQPRIERIRPDGTDRRPLLAEAASPAPSADGRWLAYLRPTLYGDALWLADADGANGRELIAATRFFGLAYPRVSPDGTRIAFVATVDQPTAPTPTLPRSPFAWRPAASGAHGLPWDVWLVDPDGGNLRRLSYLLEDDPSLAWSPDGRWLALQGGFGLTLVDASSGRTERLSRAVAFTGIDWGRE
jgi:Tol biopolymer transport system component